MCIAFSPIECPSGQLQGPRQRHFIAPARRQQYYDLLGAVCGYLPDLKMSRSSSFSTQEVQGIVSCAPARNDQRPEAEDVRIPNFISRVQRDNAFPHMVFIGSFTDPILPLACVKLSGSVLDTSKRLHQRRCTDRLQRSAVIASFDDPDMQRYQYVTHTGAKAG